MSHTLGTWHHNPRASRLANQLVYASDGQLVANVGSYKRDEADNESNAHLIAAAPELLAMLQRIRESFVAEGLKFTNLRYDIDALLAKATGQEVGA